MRNILKFLKTNKNKEILKSQNGMALLSVLILTFVLISVVIAMLTMAQNDTKLSALQRDSTRAFYLAESGIEKTIWELNKGDIEIDNNFEFRHESDEIGSSTEYYKVTVKPIPAEEKPRTTGVKGEEIKDWVYIESTGVIKGNNKDITGKRTIRVAAHFSIKQKPSIIYDKAILTNHMVTFQGNPGADIDGDIHSNYSLDIRGKGLSTFQGVATTSGVPDDPHAPYSSLNAWDKTPNGDFSGPDKWPVKEIPPVPYEELKQMAKDNGTYFSDGFDSKDYRNKFGSDMKFDGVIYVEGDIVFRNGASLTITDGALIVAKKYPDDPKDSTGTMEFKNGSNLTIQRSDPVPVGAYPGPIALAAMGNILLHAKSSSINGVVQSGGYYNDAGELLPGGLVDFRNSSVVTGAVIADEVWMHNKTTINYDGDFMQKFQTELTWGDARYNKVSWQEI